MILAHDEVQAVGQARQERTGRQLGNVGEVQFGHAGECCAEKPKTEIEKQVRPQRC